MEWCWGHVPSLLRCGGGSRRVPGCVSVTSPNTAFLAEQNPHWYPTGDTSDVNYSKATPKGLVFFLLSSWFWKGCVQLEAGSKLHGNLFCRGEKHKWSSLILIMNEVNVNEWNKSFHITAGHFPLAIQSCNISSLLFVCNCSHNCFITFSSVLSRHRMLF